MNIAVGVLAEKKRGETSVPDESTSGFFPTFAPFQHPSQCMLCWCMRTQIAGTHDSEVCKVASHHVVSGASWVVMSK